MFLYIFYIYIKNFIVYNKEKGGLHMGAQIIEAITSGLGLIGELAGQFLEGFTTLFWDATAAEGAGALTPFANFALIMLAVSITFGCVSLVLNVIRGNTGV